MYKQMASLLQLLLNALLNRVIPMCWIGVLKPDILIHLPHRIVDVICSGNPGKISYHTVLDHFV